MKATVSGYAVGEVKQVGQAGTIAIRIKERYYDSKEKTNKNRFLDVLASDKTGRLFDIFQKNPKKFVTASGTLSTRIYNNEVQLSVFADMNDGLTFADCIDRDELERQQRQTPDTGFNDDPHGDVPF